MPSDNPDDRSRDTSEGEPVTLPPSETPPAGDDIAARAYELYQSRGGEHGRDWDDWLEAERELSQRRNGPGPTPS